MLRRKMNVGRLQIDAGFYVVRNYQKPLSVRSAAGADRCINVSGMFHQLDAQALNLHYQN